MRVCKFGTVVQFGEQGIATSRVSKLEILFISLALEVNVSRGSHELIIPCAAAANLIRTCYLARSIGASKFVI